MTASDQALESLALAARAADSKGGEDLVALDVSGPLPFADVFFLATGNSERNVVAIADAIEEVLAGRRGPGAAKGTTRAAGCCSTSATSSCTCSTEKSACTTGSSGSGPTARRCPWPRCSPRAADRSGSLAEGPRFRRGHGLV